VTDDQYLRACYFGAFALVFALVLGGYFYLRHPFAAFAQVAFPRWTAAGLRRFLLTLIFSLAFAGVFSVSFYDCNHADYEHIVKDRPYVVRTTRTEVGTALYLMGAGVLFLGFVLAVARKPEAHGSDDRS
jgi:hypothetical protein